MATTKQLKQFTGVAEVRTGLQRRDPKRIKVGAAIERWRDGESREVAGRITFQLELVYNTKRLRDGTMKVYGPYGPYWYVYYWTGEDTPRQSERPRRGRSEQRSRYVGKPDAIDPRTMSGQKLANILREEWRRPSVDEGTEFLGSPLPRRAKPSAAAPPARKMPKGLTLVACAAKKLKVSAPAASLYVSTWFRKARTFAQEREDRTGDPWFILSARYGLLPPDKWIAPYDETLSALPLDKRREWAAGVADQVDEAYQRTIGVQFPLELRSGAVEPITILGGKAYTATLVPLLERMGYTVLLPLQGLAIGKQLQWLDQNART